MSHRQTPSEFLNQIRGRPVMVKLNSGVDYRGVLSCLDGYMNIALEQTEEYVNGQLKNKYGDAFIRGNNGIIMGGDFVPESDLNLQGFHKYFNSYTLRGRFNCVAATYGTIFGMILLYQLFKPAKLPPKLGSSKVKVADKSSKTGTAGDTRADGTVLPDCKRSN